MPFPYVLQIVIDEIRNKVNEGIAPIQLSEKIFNETTHIADLSLDSLGKLQLITAVEDKADVLLGDGDLHNLQTLGDLAQVVVNARQVAV